MRKAVFLDRDGVINRKAPEERYITRWEDFEFLPHVPEAIRILNRAGFIVVVVSNQRCVARGLITVPELEVMHQRMVQELACLGASIDAVYFCPHDNVAQCGCRKPSPGLLIRAAKDHSIDLSQSWMVGDSDTDVVAGKSAGCRTVRILQSDVSPAGSADLVVDSLQNAAREIVSAGP